MKTTLTAALAALALSNVACANSSTQPQPAPGAGPAASTKTQAVKRDVNASVDSLLSGYEYVPSDEDWKKLGPEALPALEKVINDPNASKVKRARAVSSMAQVAHPDASARLQLLMADAALDGYLRSRAVLALAYRDGEKAAEKVQALLGDASPDVRDAAARALGQIGGATAKPVLEARLEQEQDRAVREAIQQSLTKMQP